MKNKEDLKNMNYKDLLEEYEYAVKAQHYDPHCQYNEDESYNIYDLKNELLNRLKATHDIKNSMFKV